jgi:trans-2-enoyl-CoA reductase
MKLFGFGVAGVNYAAEVDAHVAIENSTDLTPA